MTAIGPKECPKANVLNCLPKRSQPKAKKDAEAAFDLFIDTYEPKYPKAATCLIKDREELLSFYDFPAQHWQSIRTTNPIESTFATIRHRTKRAKGLPDPSRNAAHDVQARAMRRNKLAQAARLRPPRRRHRRRRFHQRRQAINPRPSRRMTILKHQI